MKKVLLFLILIMTLSLSLFACGGGEKCDECIDSDGDGICNECGSEVEILQADLPLFIEGKPTFNIVMADDLPSKAVSAVRLLQYNLETYHKKTVSMEYESKSSVAEIEVLVGNVKSRGEKYSFDGYSLGNDGYVIKLIDTKVIINAGSEEAFSEVMEKFSEDIIGITGKNIFDVTMTAEDSIEFIQSDFDITSFKIDGVDIREFKICANSGNKTEKKVAEQIRNTLYLKTGAYLEIVSDSSGENLIHIKKVSDGNFTVAASNKKLTVSYSHENLLEQMVTNFLTEEIEKKLGAVSFSDEIYKKDTTVVYYEYFGAVGDGKTNDFAAIYNAHEAANKGGQTVRATEGKTYYIKSTSVSGNVKSAVIRTNVDWTGAKFIIDDTNLTGAGQGGSAIFKVSSDDGFASLKITDKTALASINADIIGPGTDKIEIPKDKMQGWDGPAMLVLYDSSHKVFRRHGYSNYNGSTQTELVIVDKDGNVSETTPIMFDYSNLSQISIYRLDESRAITVEGGEFTTIASRKSSEYISRNIAVSRSYTTLRNIKHFVKGELELYNQVNEKGEFVAEGANYGAFFAVASCTDVTIEGCELTGRRCYTTATGTIGTYEFSANVANNVSLVGCTQSNFWITVDADKNVHAAKEGDPGAFPSQGSVNVNGRLLAVCWGAGSSSTCKNLKYIDSTISRFDSHEGLYNGEIIGCTVSGIEVTGWGELKIEDTRWISYGEGAVKNSIVYLREDYGSTWNGKIVIKDVKAYYNTQKSNDAYLFYHSYQNWYFGYATAFPSVEIDNLKCYDQENGKILDEGFGILLNNDNHISATAKIHLPESNYRSIYAITDDDNDGFVDEPFDLNKDGKIGNTSISYDDAKSSAQNVNYGTTHPTSHANLNIVKPPEYIKILNNEGKGSFTLKIKNTAGTVSDGKHYDEIDNKGGFFGDTKFYYSETEHFTGTNHVSQDETNSFSFYN